MGLLIGFAGGLAWLGYDQPAFGWAGIGIVVFGTLMAIGALERWFHPPDPRREGLAIVAVGIILLAGGFVGTVLT